MGKRKRKDEAKAKAEENKAEKEGSRDERINGSMVNQKKSKCQPEADQPMVGKMKNVKCLPVRQAGKRTGYSFLTFTFILFLLVIIPSCNKEKVLFTEFAEIGKVGWSYSDSIRFAFTATDTSQIYDLRLVITHDEDYAWENVYVQIKTTFPDDSIKTDILSLELSDGSGAWVGKCDSGGKCRLTIPLQQHLKFPQAGDYSLTFVQHMRQEVLPGIYGLKLTITEAERQKGGTAER